MRIDAFFEKIRDDCVLLNKFVPKIKYGEETPITKQDVDRIVNSLYNICDFPPIKVKRDSFNEKHQYRIIDDENA